MSNTDFVDVNTAHAGAGSIGVPKLGTFAPLAGPTVAPDVTVLLGTREGKVITLRGRQPIPESAAAGRGNDHVISSRGR